MTRIVTSSRVVLVTQSGHSLSLYLLKSFSNRGLRRTTYFVGRGGSLAGVKAIGEAAFKLGPGGMLEDFCSELSLAFVETIVE